MLYTYPYRVAAARALRGGHLPFWNPDIYLGVPFLANAPSAVFYPANLLFLIGGQPQLLTVSMVGHVALAGIFMYLFCRQALDLSPGAALSGALALAGSGFAVGHSEQLNQGDALPWVPVIVLGLDQAYRQRDPRWAALLAVGLALEVFAGHPQIVYYTGLICGAWLLGLLIGERSVKGLALVAAGTAAGLLVAAVQFLPTLELSRQSIRGGGLPLAEARGFGMPLHGVLAQYFPDYVSSINPEWAGYVGMAATMFAVAGLVAARRDARLVALAIAAAVALLLAVSDSPAFEIAYRFVPGIPLFRAPSRIVLIVVFALSALTAVGVDRVASPRAGWRAWIPAGATLALALASFSLVLIAYKLHIHLPLESLFPDAPRSARIGGWIVLGLVASLMAILSRGHPTRLRASLALLIGVELWITAQPMNPMHPGTPSLYSPELRITSLLPDDRSPFRSLSVARPQDVDAPPLHLRDRDLYGRRGIEHPDLTMRDSLASVDGYEGGVLPLQPYIDFRQLLLAPGVANISNLPFTYIQDQPVNKPLLELLGVRNVLFSNPDTLGIVLRSGYQPVAEVDGVTVALDTAALPRAQLPTAVHEVPSDREAMAALSSGGLDLRGSVTLSGTSCGSAGGSVRLVSNEPEFVRAETRLHRAGLLVVTNSDYPGWSASVDGRPAAIGRVDGLLQGVCVPAGQHDVQLRFQPTRWDVAVGLSMAGVVLVILLAAVPWFGVGAELRRH